MTGNNHMLTEFNIITETENINIFVIRSKRKTLSLEIRDGLVKARVPYYITDRDIRTFIEKHSDWVIRKLADVRVMMDRTANDTVEKIPAISSLTKEELASIREAFLKQVSYYAEIMGVSYGRITIRNQRTRWGSCSSKGNLNFNYKLYYMPKELMDYVIIHELAHRVYMNHSKEFWSLVGNYCPDYQRCRQKLKSDSV